MEEAEEAAMGEGQSGERNNTKSPQHGKSRSSKTSSNNKPQGQQPKSQTTVHHGLMVPPNKGDMSLIVEALSSQIQLEMRGNQLTIHYVEESPVFDSDEEESDDDEASSELGSLREEESADQLGSLSNVPSTPTAHGGVVGSPKASAGHSSIPSKRRGSILRHDSLMLRRSSHVSASAAVGLVVADKEVDLVLWKGTVRIGGKDAPADEEEEDKKEGFVVEIRKVYSNAKNDLDHEDNDDEDPDILIQAFPESSSSSLLSLPEVLSSSSLSLSINDPLHQQPILHPQHQNQKEQPQQHLQHPLIVKRFKMPRLTIADSEAAKCFAENLGERIRINQNAEGIFTFKF
jgi:hypothetical protein